MERETLIGILVGIAVGYFVLYQVIQYAVKTVTKVEDRLRYQKRILKLLEAIYVQNGGNLEDIDDMDPDSEKNESIEQEKPKEKPYKIQIIEGNIKKLNGLIKRSKGKLLQGQKMEIIMLLESMVQSPEDAGKLIKKYNELYTLDLVAEIKSISNSDLVIRELLGVFIEYRIVRSIKLID